MNRQRLASVLALGFTVLLLAGAAHAAGAAKAPPPKTSKTSVKSKTAATHAGSTSAASTAPAGGAESPTAAPTDSTATPTPAPATSVGADSAAAIPVSPGRLLLHIHPDGPRQAAGLSHTIRPLGEQTSDEAIAEDLAAIDGWLVRLDSMDREQVDLWRTSLSRAWLEAARAEYIDTDRTGFPQRAYVRAVNLIGEMLRHTDPASFQTVPQAVPPGGSRKLADSLYRELEDMKHDPGFLCAASELARMEVQLAWAGNESIDQGGCRTSPHLALAADLALAARRKVDTCAPPLLAVRREPPPPPPIEVPVPVPQPVAVLPTQEELRIPRDVHFALDRADVNWTSYQVIQGIAMVLDKYPSITVRLEGHTDSRGDSTYNLALSRERVMAARTVFIGLGIDSARIATSWKGKADLYAAEDSKRGFALNRRVEMVFVDDEGRDIKLERQEGDLQLEQDRVKKPAARRTALRTVTGAASRTGLGAARTGSSTGAGMRTGAGKTAGSVVRGTAARKPAAAGTVARPPGTATQKPAPTGTRTPVAGDPH